MKVTILWRSLIEAGLSIVVKREAREEELIGACLNFDARADEAQPLCACAAFSRSHWMMEDNDNDRENLSISNSDIIDSTLSNSSNEYQKVNEISFLEENCITNST